MRRRLVDLLEAALIRLSPGRTLVVHVIGEDDARAVVYDWVGYALDRLAELDRPAAADDVVYIVEEQLFQAYDDTRNATYYYCDALLGAATDAADLTVLDRVFHDVLDEVAPVLDELAPAEEVPA